MRTVTEQAWETAVEAFHMQEAIFYAMRDAHEKGWLSGEGWQHAQLVHATEETEFQQTRRAYFAGFECIAL